LIDGVGVLQVQDRCGDRDQDDQTENEGARDRQAMTPEALPDAVALDLKLFLFDERRNIWAGNGGGRHPTP